MSFSTRVLRSCVHSSICVCLSLCQCLLVRVCFCGGVALIGLYSRRPLWCGPACAAVHPLVCFVRQVNWRYKNGRYYCHRHHHSATDRCCVGLQFRWAVARLQVIIPLSAPCSPSVASLIFSSRNLQASLVGQASLFLSRSVSVSDPVSVSVSLSICLRLSA